MKCQDTFELLSLKYCKITFIMIQKPNLHKFKMAAILFVDYHIKPYAP